MAVTQARCLSFENSEAAACVVPPWEDLMSSSFPTRRNLVDPNMDGRRWQVIALTKTQPKTHFTMSTNTESSTANGLSQNAKGRSVEFPEKVTIAQELFDKWAMASTDLHQPLGFRSISDANVQHSLSAVHMMILTVTLECWCSVVGSRFISR